MSAGDSFKIATTQTLQKILELKNLLTITVLGKGATFRVPDFADNQCIVCINDTLNELPQGACTMLAFCDIEAFSRLMRTCPQKIFATPLILCPNIPHTCDRGPVPNSLKIVKEGLRKIRYTGHLVLFNLLYPGAKIKIDPRYPSLHGDGISTVDYVFRLFGHVTLPKKIRFLTYGIGKGTKPWKGGNDSTTSAKNSLAIGKSIDRLCAANSWNLVRH